MRFFKTPAKKAGMAPGTLVHVGDRRTAPVRMSLFDYDREDFTERTLPRIEDSFPLKDRPTVTWISIDGIHDLGLMEKIGAHFDVHPLALEDIVNAAQRPKLEDFEAYLFIVLKMLSWDAAAGRIRAEQVSIVAGDHFLLSFQ